MITNEFLVFALGYRFLGEELRNRHASLEEAYEICQSILTEFEGSAFNSPHREFAANFNEYLESFEEVDMEAEHTREFLGEDERDMKPAMRSGASVLVERYIPDVSKGA